MAAILSNSILAGRGWGLRDGDDEVKIFPHAGAYQQISYLTYCAKNWRLTFLSGDNL